MNTIEVGCSYWYEERGTHEEWHHTDKNNTNQIHLT